VHSTEKLWIIATFCPGRKKEKEEGEKAGVFVLLQSCRKAPYIVA